MAKKAPPVSEEYKKIHAEHRANVEPAPVPDVVPEKVEPERITQNFKVTGRRAVYGVKPGDTGELALTQAQIDNLVEAGHLVPVESEVAEQVSTDDVDNTER